MSTATDEMIFTEIVGEFDIPCDFMGDRFCTGHAAQWVLFKRCPECGDSRALLACDDCKEARMTCDAGVICQGRGGEGCGEVIEPARRAYSRVEALSG